MTTAHPEASDTIVIGDLLERNAAESPAEIFVTFDDNLTWTREQGLIIAQSSAKTFQDAGVNFGDRVAVFLPNGPEFLAAWWGASLLGAVLVPINPAFRGAMLESAVSQADAAVIVVDDDLLDVLRGIRSALPAIVRADRLEGADFPSTALPKVHYWDDMMMIMSSGTTGPSKFSRLSYLVPYVTWGDIMTAEGCTNGDVVQVDLPLFHVAAICMTYAALVTRTRIRVRPRPVFKNYWQAVKADGITCGTLLGTVAAALETVEPSAADRDHGMRFMTGAPLPRDPAAFKARFGVGKIFAGYGSTECGLLSLGDAPDIVGAGYCGPLRPNCEVLIVDENYQAVPVGMPGQALIRTKRPFMMFSGYFRNPEASERAWRHGWYNTGDIMRLDENGHLYFVDRTGDALRRRGENISAVEVEMEVATHPAVLEAACVAVPADNGVEDEVKVWVVARPGEEIDPEQLFTHCAARMPHFMVPRFFETTDAIEKTPSLKVKKYLLRERGNSDATWDSKQHGLTVTRRGIERAAPSATKTDADQSDVSVQ